MYKKIFTLFFLTSLFIINSTMAQWCGTSITAENINFEKQVTKKLNKTAGIPGNIDKIDRCLNKTLSVTAHIVLDSTGKAGITPAQISTYLAGASSVFSPVCLSFSLCKVDSIRNFNWDKFYSDKYQTGMVSEFFTPNTINIYYVKDCNKKMLDGTYLVAAGYAALPPGMPIIVMTKTAGVGVYAHEFGHFFGLYHTFETSFGNELVTRGAGSNCLSAGDKICDTEADPEQMPQGMDANCQYLGNKKDANGDFYLPPVDNTMSYYSHAGCAGEIFTIQQFNKMISVMLNALSNRSTLW